MFMSRGGVLRLNCEKVFRGRLKACCLYFRVGLRVSEVGTTTARPAL